MAQHSWGVPRSVTRTGKLGVTMCVLAGALCALFGCTDADPPSAAAMTACANIQGTGGGGATYLHCLREHGPEATSFARSGWSARGS